MSKLIGVAMSEEPYCTILEHSLYGDLYHYLRQINKIVGPTSKASPTAGNRLKLSFSFASGTLHTQILSGSQRTPCDQVLPCKYPVIVTFVVL